MDKKDLEKAIIELLNDKNGELYKTLKEMFAKDSISIEESLKRKENEGLRIRIATILRNLGIQTNIKGYRYLQDAIVLWIEGNEKVEKIYNEIAVKNKTKQQRVERAIRHAIESGWADANKEVAEKIFAYSIIQKDKKPTNSQFISAVAEYLCYY